MNIRRAFIVVLFCLSMLAATGAQAVVGTIVVAIGRAAETSPIEVAFSADAKIETNGIRMNTKINYNKDSLRDEIVVEGQKIAVIQRFDLGRTWLLMGPGIYMEYELGTAVQAPDYSLVEKEVIGDEVINGVTTTKYRTTYRTADGTLGGFTWVNADNIAIKGELYAESGNRREELLFELSNVVTGEQPPELFELPAGATKLDLSGLGNMMKGMAPPP